MDYNKKLEVLKKANLVVGVDVGQDVHVASLIGTDGREILIGNKIVNSRDGFEGFEKLLSSWKKEDVLISMEPTGHYWKSLAYRLEDDGYKVVLINPYHTHRSKELYDNQRGTTDKKDSKLIAHLTREGKFIGCRLLRGVYLELRKLSNIREVVTKELSRSLTRLAMVLDEYLPEYKGQFCSLVGATSQKLLTEYGIKGLRDPKQATAVRARIVEVSRKKIGIDRAKAIVETLNNSIGVKEGIESVDVALQVLLRQVAHHLGELKNLNREIEEKVHATEEGKYLIQMKGVGALTAGIFLGETGNLKEYQNFKQVEKLAGLNLIENSSGKHFGQKRMSKRGRSLLRHVLYRIGIVSIKWNEEFRKIYQYKVNVLKKKKMTALISVISKILRVMFTVGRNQLIYDGKLAISGLAC